MEIHLQQKTEKQNSIWKNYQNNWKIVKSNHIHLFIYLFILDVWGWFLPTMFSLLSYEPPEWSAAAREASPHHFIQTHERSAPPRRSRGPGSDQRLQQLPPASLQKARIQELFQHLPTVGHLAPLQHPVSVLLFSGKPQTMMKLLIVFLYWCFSPSVVEEDLKMLFSSSGAVVKAFKFFQ